MQLMGGGGGAKTYVRPPTFYIGGSPPILAPTFYTSGPDGHIG